MQPVRAIGAALLFFGMVACGGGGGSANSGGGPSGPATPVLTTINVSLSPATVAVGQTSTATASGLDQNGAAIAVGTVTWSSGTPATAAVNSSGVVTGVAVGTTSIVATVGSKQGQSSLTVTPVPVATVSVAPTSVTVALNGTQQFTATTLDATGATLTGRVVSWTSSDPTKVTVSATGLATAAAGGSANVTATSEGKSASAVVTVTPPPVASVTVTPSSASLAVGANQTLTATTLDANGNVLAGRVVTWSSGNPAVASTTSPGSTATVTGVGAGLATITATSESKSGTSQITVTSQQACSPATALQLALGEVRTLTAAQQASLCLGGTGAGSEFVLIPFSNSTVAANLVSVTITGTNTTANTVQPMIAPRRLAPPGQDLQSAVALGERAFRARELQDIGPLAARSRAARLVTPRAPGALRLTGIPANPTVGSVVQINANLNGNTCTNPKQLHAATVVAVLPHTIVLSDNTSPTGGYTTAEMTAFGTAFDTLGFALDTLNFGAPTDIDANGRLAILFTPGVNLIPAPAGGFIGGLFASRDLIAANASGCVASNEGEMFYMPVPDPNQTLNGNYKTKTTLANTVLATLVHEFQHLINAGRRIYVNNAPGFEEVWLNEGLSHIAEELLYYRVSGNSPRSDIGLSTLQQSPAQVDAYNTYLSQNFGRLDSYLISPSTNSPFSQVDGLAMRGAIWELLRYSADRKGGTERNTWFALVNSTTSGQANFNAVFGNIITNTRDWTVAQFADDDGLGVAANYTNPSWNFRSIYPALTSPSTYPIATTPLITGAPVTLTLGGGGAAYVRFRVSAAAPATIAGTSSGQPVPSTIDFILIRTQ